MSKKRAKQTTVLFTLNHKTSKTTPMKRNHYSRQIRQFDRLVSALIQAVKEGQSSDVIQKIRLKIAVLLRSLASVLSKKQLIHKLGAFAIFFGLASSAQAQTFAAPVANPFGLTANSYLGGMCAADYDNDGDLDLMVGGLYSAVAYYENTGTATIPTYAAPVDSAFGMVIGSSYTFLTTADIDNDGDFDIFAGYNDGAVSGPFRFFENIGSATTPSFAAGVDNPFGLTSAFYLSFPELADIDNDGDFDLISGEYQGNFKYFENTGTASSPSFAAPLTNPFGLTQVTQFGDPNLADLDHDGDLDMLLSTYYGVVQYFENTGSAASPTFAAPVTTPFGLTANPQVALFEMIDMDGDSDLDVLVHVYDASFVYYENTEFNAGIQEFADNAMVSPNPFMDILNIESKTNVERVDVYSLAGTLVHSANQPGTQVNLGMLESGVYMIHVIDSKGAISQMKVEKM